MKKYSFEFKLKIVHDYLAGKGGTSFLEKKYGFKSNNQIRKWLNVYKEFGEEGLLRSRKNRSYSVQFKLDAIELYLTTEMSFQEVANQLEMNNFSLIANWLRSYRKNGLKGLSKMKGRPSKMPKKISEETEPIKTGDTERIKELEKQLRMAQIENAYLKELRRLRLKERHKKMKLVRKSSTASENILD